ncbi:DNA binding methylated-DNA--cysteine S-methyltransferase [Hypoxylon sp. FL1284]|nr:DNA binding methylated-DNA--cysteine S-methyltransferase [Hypoxylon sp. FL1284]
MAPSEETEAFNKAVCNAVQQIPYGKVTSYGHIAKLIGTRTHTQSTIQVEKLIFCIPAERPRQVGICLRHLSRDARAVFNHQNVPWQRVVNVRGAISLRYLYID